MRLIFLLVLFTSLFACDTSSNSKAYQNYTTSKQQYIQSILDNNTKQKIKALQEIVKCGKFLGFNVSKYNQRLNELTHTLHKTPKTKSNLITKNKVNNKFQNPLKIESSYIKVLSLHPIKIKLSKKMYVKYFRLYKKNQKRKYYYVFDIYNAKINRAIIKKLNDNSLIKIVQNNKKRVRLVIYSIKKISLKYSKKYPLLSINYEKYHIQSNISKKYVNFPQYRKKIIVIDPGHGGKDPGGIGAYRVKEKNIVLPIGKYLKTELSKRGYKIYLTRNKDEFITLRNRTKFANKKHADLFLSIHCNIAPKHPEVYGIETYFLSPARGNRAKRVAKLENSAIGNLHSTTQNIVLNFLNKTRIVDSTKLALDIQKSLIFNLKKHYRKIKDGGVRPAPFWVLVGTNMPAILIETGFISNKNEAKKLINKIYQKRYAKYIADGIDNYFRKNP